MRNIVFNLADLHLHGSAFYDFLRLRKRFFVDQLGWKIPHDADVEMDQYDNPKAYYSLVLRGDEVVGGARVMATTAEWGSHTYMLRDAVAGKLIGIPADILPDAQAAECMWEVTRVVISDSLTNADERAACFVMMLDGIVDVAAAQGASELLSLSPLAMARTLRRLGYDAVRIGAPYKNAEDGRRYACVSMPAKRSAIGRDSADTVDPLAPSQNDAASKNVLTQALVS